MYKVIEVKHLQPGAFLLAVVSAAVLLVQMLASLHDPRSGDMLDRGLVLRFPGPASFTGTADLTDRLLRTEQPATE